MMEKTIETCFTNQIDIQSANRLKISLIIERNRYDIPHEYLFETAVRNNPKRRFLFVSKVLGKHIPINPLTLRIIGGILARTWMKDAYNEDSVDISILIRAFLMLSGGSMTLEQDDIDAALKAIDTPINPTEKTLFIGFAETATGIAQAVFNCFSNSAYIHTTREYVNGLIPSFVFNEEHSHAALHMLFPKDVDMLYEYDRIVLIDDELTTGKTSYNLISKLPGNKFGQITILDWRENNTLEELNNDISKSVYISSLIKGKIKEVTEKPDEPNDNQMAYSLSNETIFDEVFITNENNNMLFNTSYNGRFGITSKEQQKINSELKKIANSLETKRVSGNLLCLGTEEFIYTPCVISSMLSGNVFFHSTTRSPILGADLSDYCIKNKMGFESPYEHNRKNYIYNIPVDFYSQVFVFLEKPIETASKQMFLSIFKEFNINNIVFIIFQ